MTSKSWSATPVRDNGWRMASAGTDLETLLRLELGSQLDTQVEFVSNEPVALDARAGSVIRPVLKDAATALSPLVSARQRLDMSVTWWRDAQGRCVIELNTVGRPCEWNGDIRHCGDQNGVFQRSAEEMIRFDTSDSGVRIVVPAKYILNRAPAGSSQLAALKHSDPVAGRSVLVVEDQLIIALDLEMLLREEGAAEVYLSGSVADALRTIDAENLDLAVLDVNLGNTTSFPVARELKKRGVPFIFATGYGNEIEFPPELRTIPIVGKPYCVETMREALLSTSMAHA